MKPIVIVILAMSLCTGRAVASPPSIDNAELDLQFLALPLGDWVRQWAQASAEAGWVGWHVPMIEGNQLLCCGRGIAGGGSSRVCRLAEARHHLVAGDWEVNGRPLTNANLTVLLRADGEGELQDLRVYDEVCPLNAGGTRLTWLEEVDPAESVGLLRDLIEGTGELTDEALMALALHRAPQAAAALTALAQRHRQPRIRGAALFWVAHTGVPGADEVLLAAVDSEGDANVRDEAVFALSQLPQGKGLELLLEIARDGAREPSLRQQAFFWFVQQGDDQALALIDQILNP